MRSGIHNTRLATGDTPGLTVEIASGTHDGEQRGRAARLSDHFAQVSARYRTLRELDVGAVRLISDVVARAADPGRPVRLVDVATGSGRYLDAVRQGVGASHAREVVAIGLDRSLPMLRQARRRTGHAGRRAGHLVGAVETLPFRAASCDVMTCFNAVHHFDLAGRRGAPRPYVVHIGLTPHSWGGFSRENWEFETHRSTRKCSASGMS